MAEIYKLNSVTQTLGHIEGGGDLFAMKLFCRLCLNVNLDTKSYLLKSYYIEYISRSPYVDIKISYQLPKA